MIDVTKLKPGDKVRVREDARSIPECAFVTDLNQYLGQVVTFESVGSFNNIIVRESSWVFHPSWLDPVDEPKLVEVVTETKTVVKEVVIRLPADMAKQIASVCGLPGWDEYSKQIHAAIAEQEAKS